MVDFLVKHNGRNIDTIRTWHIVKTSFLQSCLAAFFFYVLWICLAMCLFYLKRVFCVHFLWRGSFFSLFAVSVVSDRQSMYGALRDLVPFVQYKKREKHPWRSVNFSKVAFHGCFSCFLNSTNGTKSRNAPHIGRRIQNPAKHLRLGILWKKLPAKIFDRVLYMPLYGGFEASSVWSSVYRIKLGLCSNLFWRGYFVCIAR